MGNHDRNIAGDPLANSGVWSPPTSKMNFCEEDYAFTLYIAEFINTLTNLAYVYFGLRFMYGPGSRGLFAPRVDFMSFSLLVLGIGSFIYHATLRQTLQLVDDLSMFVAAWSMLQSILTLHQSPGRARLATVALTLFVPAASVFYVWTGKFQYHAAIFLGMVGLIVMRTLYLFHWLQPALPEAKRRDWGARTWKSIGVSVFGYILWNIDLEFCKELRELRQQIGLPWAWLLELHGWWHILTALGLAIFMEVAREMRDESRLKKTE